MNKKMKCRYIDNEGVCMVKDALCDRCLGKNELLIKSSYDPVFNVTVIVIINKYGSVLMCRTLYGQFEECAIKAYGTDMLNVYLKNNKPH